MRHAFTKLLKDRRSLVSPHWRKAKLGLSSLQAHINYLRSVRNGSKISRFFRHIFEHKHARRVLGSNLALFAALAGVVGPTPTISGFSSSDSLIISAPEDQLSTDVALRAPLEYEIINQGYSYYHPGIDYEGVTGEPVYPVMEGRVISVQYSRYDYGNAVYVDHENGYSSLYAHLSKLEVAQGQEVDMFTPIGDVGSTGRSTGDHLHIEIYKEGKTINPLTIIPN